MLIKVLVLAGPGPGQLGQVGQSDVERLKP